MRNDMRQMATTEEKMAQTLILGLGNDLRGDDAVGLLVIAELRRRFSERTDLAFDEASVGGLGLLDVVMGYRHLVVVDAIQTRGGRPGDVHRLSEEDLCAPGSSWFAHQMGLKTVLEMGRKWGCDLPEDVVVYTVEVADVQTWRQGCAGEVQAAIYEIIRRITEEELGSDRHLAAEIKG
jgi:hydrogenase maturation protease